MAKEKNNCWFCTHNMNCYTWQSKDTADGERVAKDCRRFDKKDRNEYTSSTRGDYGPGCPWNAPGMSIGDFI